jgi:hypothetical protein
LQRFKIESGELVVVPLVEQEMGRGNDGVGMVGKVRVGKVSPGMVSPVTVWLRPPAVVEVAPGKVVPEAEAEAEAEVEFGDVVEVVEVLGAGRGTSPDAAPPPSMVEEGERLDPGVT